MRTAATLQAALNADAGAAAGPPALIQAAAPVATPAAPPAERSTVELLVYRVADDLDLPPRRMRGAVTRLLRSLRAAGLSLEQVERELEMWAQRLS